MTEDSDSLFSEATTELQEDVQSNLANAEAALPDPDAVWETDATNIIGVLNQIQSVLDTGDAEEAFKEARKWYLLGNEAGAFTEEEQAELEERFESVEDAFTSIESVSEGVEGLIPDIPALKSSLENVDSENDPVLKGEGGDAVESTPKDATVDVSGDSETETNSSEEDEESVGDNTPDGVTSEDDSEGGVSSWGGSDDSEDNNVA